MATKFYTPKKSITVNVHPFALDDGFGELVTMTKVTVLQVLEGESQVRDNDWYIVDVEMRNLKQIKASDLVQDDNDHYQVK